MNKFLDIFFPIVILVLIGVIVLGVTRNYTERQIKCAEIGGILVDKDVCVSRKVARKIILED